VERRLSLDETHTYPVCIGGKRAAPPAVGLHGSSGLGRVCKLGSAPYSTECYEPRRFDQHAMGAA
jgi:hypothetical protein